MTSEHHRMQEMIAARRPAAAIAAAARTAPTIALSDTLTWAIAAAVLGHVTGHPHALQPDTTHTAVLKQILDDGSADSGAFVRAHPGHTQALDLAASPEGLTALYGLVYGWTISLHDHDADQQIDAGCVEGSWRDAETTAVELLAQHDIVTGHAEILTCIGTGSTIEA